MDPEFLSGLGKIRVMRIGITCIGRDWDLPICPVQMKMRITCVRIKQSCLYYQVSSITLDKKHRENIPTFECLIVRVASYSEPGRTLPFTEETIKIKLPMIVPNVWSQYGGIILNEIDLCC